MMDAKELDEWRLDEAQRVVCLRPLNTWVREPAWQAVLEEYRRLVRENVVPPAEPDEPCVAERLWAFTKHGDEKHQRWLREKLHEFFGTTPPPAEPDQDTKDVDAILMAWFEEDAEGLIANYFDGDAANRGKHHAAAKAALREIKSRVAREAIMALPDDWTTEVRRRLRQTSAQVSEHDYRNVVDAIKQVYGKG